MARKILRKIYDLPITNHQQLFRTLPPIYYQLVAQVVFEKRRYLMGNTLTKPVTTKETICGKISTSEITSDTSCRRVGGSTHSAYRSRNQENRSQVEKEPLALFGLSSCQGWRINQEDTFLYSSALSSQERERVHNGHNNVEYVSGGGNSNESAEYLLGHALFGIFDGHGGFFAAAFCSEIFHDLLCKEECFVEYCKIYRRSFAVDNEGNSHLKSNGGRRKKKSQKQQVRSAKAGIAADTNEQLKDLLENSLRNTFLEMDRELLIKMKDLQDYCKTDINQSTLIGTDPDEQDQGFDLFDSGTAAIVIIITPTFIVCANAGDCRAILSNTINAQGNSYNDIVPLSFDHKPSDPEEESRIRFAGGCVDRGLVDGELALSRALGDFTFKSQDSVLTYDQEHMHPGVDNNSFLAPGEQKVSPLPDIITLKHSSLLNFLVVASDGIWDVITSDECAELVADIFQEGESNLDLVAEEVSPSVVTIIFIVTHRSRLMNI